MVTADIFTCESLLICWCWSGMDRLQFISRRTTHWRFKQASSKHIRRFKVVCSVLLLYRLVKMPLLIGCGELEPNERELKSWKERDKLVSVFLWYKRMDSTKRDSLLLYSSKTRCSLKLPVVNTNLSNTCSLFSI